MQTQRWTRPVMRLPIVISLFMVLFVSGILTFPQRAQAKSLPCSIAATTATQVYGQPDMTTGTPNTGGVSRTSLNGPTGVALEGQSGTYLDIADTENNRVLWYTAGITSAYVVYGQSDFSTTTINTNGLSATSLYRPTGVAVDNMNHILYITDQNNSRVLGYSSGSLTVFGQSNFTTNAPGVSDHSLNYPFATAIDGSTGSLYIADAESSRVLHVPAGSSTADRVYGQANFTSWMANANGVNGYPTASSLRDPAGLTASGNDLYIADWLNNRVLHYSSGSTTADLVYGQGDFISASVGTSATTLNQPRGVVLDGCGRGIYVADWGNNRVLHFPLGSPTADLVYGQPNFTSNTAGTSATSLKGPIGLAVGCQKDSILNRWYCDLYVADTGNNRVLYFP
jgi:hypothetical protein